MWAGCIPSEIRQSDLRSGQVGPIEGPQRNSASQETAGQPATAGAAMLPVSGSPDARLTKQLNVRSSAHSASVGAKLACTTTSDNAPRAAKVMTAGFPHRV